MARLAGVRLVGPVALALVYALFGIALLGLPIVAGVLAVSTGVVQSGLKPGHVLIGLGGLVKSGALGIGLLLFAWRLVVVGSLTRPIALLSPDGYRRLGVLFVALALVMIAGGLLAPFEDWYMAPICPGMIALACFYIAGALGDT